MDKKQQIEEMAKEYCKTEFHCSISCQTDGCRTYEICDTLYNAGYRKIDDDCAVITKAELKQYKVQTVKEFAEMLKECAKSCKKGGYDGIGEDDIDLILKEYEK